MKYQTPWGPIGEFVYNRTYSRKLATGGKETFEQTIDRVLDGVVRQLGVQYTSEERQEAKNIMMNLKGVVAGRFLWQLGTRTVDDIGFMSLMNCAACVVDGPVRPFTWTFDALMLGSGVGYNIQLKHVYSLPKVIDIAEINHMNTKDADFIVPDSRSGWVELLSRILEAYFVSGKSFSYSTILVRGAGEPISGFGGTASGPGILIDGMDRIQKVLRKRIGSKLSPIDVLDMMNIIGSVVVAGNVRRSAQIAIGDIIDSKYLKAKNWELGNIPNHRAMSNNSVVVKDIADLPETFWAGYLGDGEPYGLINMPLCKAVGRTGDTKYPDPEVEALNPCGEQTLANMETCCLSECFLPNNESFEELLTAVKVLYRINKHALRLPCHIPETEAIVHKNMRMGIGITGYLQASKEQRAWLPKVYKALREYDKEYSSKMGWPESIKLTTIKPSGTLSLLAGVTPGVHPGFSLYHIRRVRVSTEDPLVVKAQAAGYRVEFVKGFDGKPDYSTSIISFPCRFPEGTVVAKDLSAVDQLNYVKRLQKDWSDNSVSCTVYYRLEELNEIRKWLEQNYAENIKAVSFLLHSDHGFKQAPLEELSEEQYLAMCAEITAEIIYDNVGHEVDDSLECGSGHCPVI